MSYNKSICTKWINKPLINPLSSHNIKFNGPTYKLLYNECSKIIDLPSELTKKNESHNIYDKFHCDKWRKNPLVNPLSNRTIKKNGKIYKIIEKACSNKIKLIDNVDNKILQEIIHKELCKKWLKNKGINPSTKKVIKINGPTYNKYKKNCIDLNISSSTSSSSNELKTAPTSHKSSKSSSSYELKTAPTTDKSSTSSSSYKLKTAPTSHKSSTSSSSYKLKTAPTTHKSSTSSSSYELKTAPTSHKSSKSSSSNELKTAPTSHKTSKSSSSNELKTAPTSHKSSKSSFSNELKTAPTSHKSSTFFSKSSTSDNKKLQQFFFNEMQKSKFKKDFLNVRINIYNLINKYISKITTKYENNCIKKYKIVNGKELLRIGNKIILDTVLGSPGSYGIVYHGYYRPNNIKNKNLGKLINFAVKICEKNVNNKNEIEVLTVLTKYVKNTNFPNFPILYGYLECDKTELNDVFSSEPSSGSLVYSNASINSNYNDFLRKDNSYFIINELADGDMNIYLDSKVNRQNSLFESNEVVYNAIIQALLSIIYFHSVTNLAHNDTHLGNFLFHKIQPGGYFHYKIFNTDIYVKNIGYLWVINDFGIVTEFTHKYEIEHIIDDFKIFINDLSIRSQNYFIDSSLSTFINELYDNLERKIYNRYNSTNDSNFLEDLFNQIHIKILNCLIRHTTHITLKKPSIIININNI